MSSSPISEIVAPPSKADHILETEVIVVGAGPCGMTMANLLGSYGVRCVVIDRSPSVLNFPRAVGIDDESLRTYQAVGLVEEVLADTLQNTAIRYHTSWGRCFAHVKPSMKPFGWPRRNLFLQPLLEETLRRGATRFETVELRLGCELETLVQSATGVQARTRLTSGELLTVDAQYLVGADGGRSTVRGLVGIELTGTTAPAKWLVIDVADDELDAPYSAVYCSPIQPVLVVPLPYRHRRFEFLLQPGDDEEAVVQPAHVTSLLAPRYGATQLPTIVSSRVYLHHSRIAESFQSGRVFLAGDAAHLQPPFFGQGMNSGIRDATNLAWKLAVVTKGQASARVLETYDEERRGHAGQMVEFATRIGAMYQPRNVLTERIRDVAFRILHLIPGGQEYILQMKYKPMPRYTVGVVLKNTADPTLDDVIGRLFMQPVVETTDRKTAKLDDAIGDWFAVIGLHVDPASALDSDSLAWWRSLGARFVHIVAPRSGPPPHGRSADTGASAAAGPEHSLILEDIDGAFRDWMLAHPNADIVVLRPDRYVAAVAQRSQWIATTSELRSLLGSSPARDVSVDAGLRSQRSAKQEGA
jgi:3-(3-hydroxy-phenyl)propionate hydroxylase